MNTPPAQPRDNPAMLRHGIDRHTATDARVWDWLLGGIDHYAADRRAADALLELAPNAHVVALQHRAFRARAVRTLVDEHNIDQFLDLGGGIPDPLDPRTIADHLPSTSRYLHVDHDPHAHAHARTLLDEDTHTDALHADMTDLHTVLDHPAARRVLAADRPTGVLLTAALHGLTDDTDVTTLLRRLHERLAPHSLIVLSHLVADDDHDRTLLTDHMRQATDDRWGRVRTRAEIDAFLDGYALLDPGLVDVAQWRPDPDRGFLRNTHECVMYGGIARLS
ncbi:SAM-dependent methyltransferase [Embleya sp. MST-111070]|uniref:SAM-dependent methyltransferase n=1 Tax=Embleya sp. MST-111070 TaxID=3398231 RepID=UPI003F740E5F